MVTSDKSKFGFYFLGFVFIIYLICFIFFNLNLFLVFNKFVNIFLSLIPIFIFMFIVMVLIDYFVKPKILVKYMGSGSGIKGYLISIISGIISSGPIYMWYPMLADLKESGVKSSLILVFLYNRAVKLPLLPLLIVYFGLYYSITLLVVMIFVSVLQGLFLEFYFKISGGEI